MMCICGHQDGSHVDKVGACTGERNACECEAFSGLCMVCRHAMRAHYEDGCARVLMSGDRRGERCGCDGKPSTNRVSAMRKQHI